MPTFRKTETFQEALQLGNAISRGKELKRTELPAVGHASVGKARQPGLEIAGVKVPARDSSTDPCHTTRAIG
jgi:hypothetical protein